MKIYGFDGNAGSSARTVGFQEDVAGTLEAGKVKHVLCLMDQGGGVMSTSENKTGTLRAEEHGHQPVICYGITAQNSNSMKSSNPHSGIYEADRTRTLDMNGGNPSCAQGGTMIVEDKAFCLQGGGVTSQNSQGSGVNEDVSFTLNSTDRHAVYDPSVHHGYRQFDDVSETVRSRYGTGGNNQPLVVATMQGLGDYVESDKASSCKQRDYKDATDLVYAAVDVRNGSENSDVNGTLQAKSNGGWNANSQNIVRVYNNVRRLTPLECERLQGYPDGWTDIPGATDSKRYKALGNSIALPFWEFLAHRFVKMGEVESIGSLFDGIGGFPLVFGRAGAETKWTSEIEPFCQKVVEYHFGNEETGEEGDVWKYVK